MHPNIKSICENILMHFITRRLLKCLERILSSSSTKKALVPTGGSLRNGEWHLELAYHRISAILQGTHTLSFKYIVIFVSVVYQN